MKKLIKLLIITSLVIAAGIAVAKSDKINFVSTARALADLTIDWGVPSGQPIFNVPNFMPGDSETRTVIISNGSSSNRQLGLRAIPTLDLGSLSTQINIVINENGSPIFSAPLSDLFLASTDPNFIQFDILPPSTSATYEFIATFNPSAGDEYQGTSVVFDIVIGLAFDLPRQCEAIPFTGKVVFGTSKSENLNGTPKNDIIIAFEGDDKVEGNNGDDCIIGGPGNDRLNGNNGKDAIFGDEGDDKLYGNNQDDFLDGGPDTDRTEGNNGTDTCIAETRLHCELP